MPTFDWELPPRYPTCPQADAFYRTARELFRQLSPTTTPAQFQAAQAALEQLRNAFMNQLAWSHFGLSVGTHRCVTDLFHEACARLRSLEVVQTVPQQAPPAPAPKPRSLTDVLRELGGMPERDTGE
jgi:hypothetical protein